MNKKIFLYYRNIGRIKKSTFLRSVVLLCVVSISLLWHTGSRSAGENHYNSGSAVLYPDTVQAGKAYSWELVYAVGDEGIAAGGGIKVQFPNNMAGFNSWMYKSQRPYIFKNHQTHDPDGWNYVGAESSRKDVKVTVEITQADIDGREGYAYRSSRVFTIKLSGGKLDAGETITVRYGNTSASVVRERTAIGIAVDAFGDGRCLHIAHQPYITVQSAEPVEMHLIGPSQAVVGKPALYKIRVLDKYGNQADGFRAELYLTASSDNAEIPDTLEIVPDNKGILNFTALFKQPGIHRIELTDNQHLAHIGISSNPIHVFSGSSDKNIYWGDIHSHSDFSNASIGLPETAFHYANNVAGLDFYALTPQRTWREEPREEQYEKVRGFVRSNYIPGTFVTFLGMEWQGHSGDHNTIFLKDDVKVPFTKNYPSYSDLVGYLDEHAVDAITVPHHTGIKWNGYFPGYKEFFENLLVERGREALMKHGTKTDWSIKSPYRAVGEIYSLHGSSEYYGAPGMYDDVDNTLASAVPTPHYLRDAWEQGHIIGVSGSTDDHFARPGRIYGGAVAVYAPELTREAIFAAIKNRQTYATTGHRILMNFSINDNMMGSIIHLRQNDVPRLEINVSALDDIEIIEVFKYDGFQWNTVVQSSPKAKDVSMQFTDFGFSTSSLYYVRVIQKGSYHAPAEIRPRKIMAWSSPIWVKQRDTAWWDK